MKRLFLIALVQPALASAACSGVECEAAPAGFALVVAAPDLDIDVRSISVSLTIEDQSWRQSFELGDTLVDGETSFYVAVEPAPTVEFDAELLVEGYSETGRMTARGTGRFVATPDACNRFRVTLARAGSAERRGGKHEDEDDD
jgi:hypothetical protein